MQTGRLRRLSRVVVETTGLADPAPILASLMAHPALVQAYALGAVVCVVDAAAGAEGLEGRVEAERQIACADRIVLTKTDLASGGPDEALAALIARLNPAAPLIEASAGTIDAETLLGSGLYDLKSRQPDIPRWLGEATPGHHHDGHHHRHGTQSSVRSFSIVHPRPIPEARVEDFLGLLSSMLGPSILRMKAVVWTLEKPLRPLVLHGARRQLHPPAYLPAWPHDMEPHSRFVLIGDGLDETLARDLFAAATGSPRTDAPDRAALLDNPLTVPGMSFR